MDPRIDQIVLLAGGRGSRLGPETDHVPKPMIAFEGRPLLEWLIRYYAVHGFKKAIISAGWKAEVIHRHFSGLTIPNLQTTIHAETSPRGTAGAIADLEDRLDEHFLVCNADTWTAFDLPCFSEFASKSRDEFSAVVLLGRQQVAKDQGGAVLNGDRITRFAEKRADNEGVSLNAGVYAFNKTALLKLIDRTPLSLEVDVLPAMAASGNLAGFSGADKVFDIGTPERLSAAREEIGLALIQATLS